MKNLEKLINSIWIHYHPKSKLFTLELLHDRGCAFVLDLNVKEDIEEFEDLIKVFNYTNEHILLESCSSTLEIKWTKGYITFTHDTMMIANPFNNPVDAFDYEDSEKLLEMLINIKKLT